MLDSVLRLPSSSQRRYTDDAIEWVRFLTRLLSTGMPIRRMREHARLVGAGDGNDAERLSLLEQHRQTVAALFTAMQRNLGAIEHKIDLYRALPGH